MPELSILTYSLLALAGLAAGFVDSIAGGGGLITVPVLLAAGFPPHLALGTNKLQSSFGSLTSALNYRRSGLFSFRQLWQGVAFTALGAFCGTMMIQQLATDVLSWMIPVLLTLIFLYMVFKPNVGREDCKPRLKSGLFYLLGGLVLGFYDGFFGPGTGNIWSIAFVTLLGLNLKSATAHTKVMNFTSNLVSLITFAAMGSVMLLPGIIMGVGQLTGAWLGSTIVIQRGVGFVRVFFLFVVGITLLKLLYDLL
jgi:uncharacterized protein